MALSDKGFVEKINSCLNGNLSEIQNAQLADSISKISSYKIDSVATFAALPVASENTGRMVFVVDEDVYYYSDGESWTKDLISNLANEIYVWGSGTYGRLGDGTTTSKCSPVSVVGGFTDWCQVSAGSEHTAAVRTNGTLWTWGRNNSGQLGDGTIVNKSSPVTPLGNFLWCSVAVGGSNHTLAIRNNGTLWAWGSQGGNDKGSLGDGTTVDKSSPVSVVGGFTNWCQVSAGGNWSAGIRTNGTIWTWGENCCVGFGCGQLGDGTFNDRCSPGLLAGGFTDWCQVSNLGNHGAALRTNGTIWTWGRNSNGQLGDGTVVTRNSPVSVIGGFTDWCQVSAGSEHTAAVRTNGTLWTWGSGSVGKLGNNCQGGRCSPVSVVGGFTDWCQVSAGSDHTAAVRTNGTLWAWGSAERGALGDGTNVCKSSPVSVLGNFSDWISVSVGEMTVALRYQKGF